MITRNKAFISHSGLDNDLIDQFDRSLKVVGIEPFLAERFPATGENVPKKIAYHIRDSYAFVPVITKKSLTNQWVNQEIGYAYHLLESGDRDSPYFFPIVENGLGDSIKGFLGIPVTEYIPLDRQSPNDSIYRLLLGLRVYMKRYLDYLSITCPSCRKIFKKLLPEQRDINKAIDAKKSLEAPCRNCDERVSIDPRTLLVTGSSSGQTW